MLLVVCSFTSYWANTNLMCTWISPLVTYSASSYHVLQDICFVPLLLFHTATSTAFRSIAVFTLVQQPWQRWTLIGWWILEKGLFLALVQPEKPSSLHTVILSPPFFHPSLPLRRWSTTLFYTPQIRNPPSLHTLILAHSSPSPPSFLSSLLPSLPPPTFPHRLPAARNITASCV